MKLFKGSIKDALSSAKRKKCFFVVVVCSKNLLTEVMVSAVNSRDISVILGSDKYISILVNYGSDEYYQFVNIYRNVPVPSFCLFGSDGKPITIISNELTEDVKCLRKRILRALLLKTDTSNNTAVLQKKHFTKVNSLVEPDDIFVSSKDSDTTNYSGSEDMSVLDGISINNSLSQVNPNVLALPLIEGHNDRSVIALPLLEDHVNGNILALPLIEDDDINQFIDNIEDSEEQQEENENMGGSNSVAEHQKTIQVNESNSQIKFGEVTDLKESNDSQNKLEIKMNECYIQNTSAKSIETDERYTQNNPDKIIEIRESCTQNNPDEISKIRYTQNNPDEISKTNENYIQNNPDEIDETNESCIQNNRDEINKTNESNIQNENSKEITETKSTSQLKNKDIVQRKPYEDPKLQEFQLEKARLEQDRQRILNDIAIDKQERILRQQNMDPSVNQFINMPSEIELLALAENETRIQFRKPDGSVCTEVFNRTDLLNDLRSHIINNMHIDSRQFKLATPFPMHIFTDAENLKSLEDLHLTPNAVIVIIPSSESANILSGILSYITYPIAYCIQVIKYSILGIEPPQISDGILRRPVPRTNNQNASTSNRKPFIQGNSVNRGNVHTISSMNQNKDKDKNSVWNGNSTQQFQ